MFIIHFLSNGTEAAALCWAEFKVSADYKVSCVSFINVFLNSFSLSLISDAKTSENGFSSARINARLQWGLTFCLHGDSSSSVVSESAFDLHN